MNEAEISKETLNEILEILQNSEYVKLNKIELESTHDSLYYEDMITMPSIDIQFNDIKWMLGFWCEEEVTQKIIINCKKINIPVFDYICEVIQYKKYEKRDKIVLILAHIETCIFHCLEIVRKSSGIVKNINRVVSQNDDTRVTNANYARIFLMGIVKVIYANTDKFEHTLDKRIPFRNHILHHGIVEYMDEEIETMYLVLISFFEKIVECELIFSFERKIKCICEEKLRNKNNI